MRTVGIQSPKVGLLQVKQTIAMDICYNQVIEAFFFACYLIVKNVWLLIQQGKTGKGWQSTASGLSKFWIDPRVSLSWTIFWKTESCNSRSYALNTDAAGAGLSLLWFEDKNPNVRFPLVRFSSTVNLVYNDHPRGAQTMWSLLKCGRCSEVAFFLQK